MQKKNTTRNALLISVISLLLCVSMLVGTTFAWFTDSVTSGRNLIRAGNLDVALAYWDGDSYEEVTSSTKLFNDAALWEPGYTEVAYLKVSNAGSLALKYQLAATVFNETLGKTKAGEAIKLSEHLVFKVVESETDLAGTYNRETAKTAAGSVKGLNSYNSGTKKLEPKNAVGDNDYYDYVALIIYMPESVGNEANHNGINIPSIEMGVSLYATQLEYEADSFNDQYDKDAGYNYGKNNVGPHKLNVLSGGNAVYDEATKTYTVTVDTVAQGGYNATQGGRYFAGYTVSVADYGENATLKFDKDAGEVSWKLADEERDGFINNGVHQQWTSVGTQRAYRYDVNGDGVTDFTVVNDASKAKVEAANADELKKLLDTGVSAILTADISLDVAETGFTVAKDVTAKLDLNDHDIIATATSAESVQLFSVSGALDITGKGTISLTNDNYAWTESYRYTAINIRETGAVTLDNGVKVVCEAGKATAKGYGMAYAVDIYTTGTLHVNGASLHSNYIAVRCFYGDSVVNVGSGSSITSSNRNYGIWPQSAPGATITVAADVPYTVGDFDIYIFG